MAARWTCTVVAALLLAGCGGTAARTAVATNPPQGSGAATSPGGPTASGASGVRTVLSPLGLNIRSAPSVTAARLGTAAQGVVLSILGHTDQDGGWFHVQGQTLTGWITASPALTAAGTFTAYQSSDRGFSALYPQDWTFAESQAYVLFHPLNGPQTIVVRNGARVADFGPSGAAGFVATSQAAVVVCGVTGDLNEYAHGGPVTATPAPGTPGPLALLAQVRLRLDPAHALALDFNYTRASDLDVFAAFYDSMTFPFPQCERPAAPAATP